MTIFWITLLMKWSYQGPDYQCKGTYPGEEVYLSAEMQGSELKRLQLNNYSFNQPHKASYRNFPFTAEQMGKVATFVDKKGNRWLEKLTLSGPQVGWLLYEAGTKGLGCPIPAKVKAITPVETTLEFEREGIDDGILVSYAPTLSLKGELVDGRPFTATLRLMQKVYRPWEILP